MNETPESSLPVEVTTAQPPERPRRWAGNPIWMGLAAAGLALAAWQWVETRQRLSATQEELARRLAESEVAVREARTVARQANDTASALNTRLGVVDGKLVEFQSQYAALETMYQELARGRDEWVLAEVEQLVAIAGQQLQLAGNVQAALLALGNADATLARADRPYFLALRKAVARDHERLRNLPFVDVPGISMRIEQMVLAVDRLPVAYQERPRPEGGRAGAAAGKDAAAAPRAPTSWWASLLDDAWKEVRGLVRIQRFDRPEPALLSPSHEFFLRENFKLRLLNARLALLARDELTFRGELKQAQAWVERHFDMRERSVQTVAEGLAGLLAAEVAIELPNLNDSQTALRTVKLGRERASR